MSRGATPVGLETKKRACERVRASQPHSYQVRFERRRDAANDTLAG